jgi:hypothetical protein
MAKSYHSAALPMHAAAIARRDMLREFARLPVLVADMLLSVVSPSPRVAVSSDLRVHPICMMSAVSAHLTMVGPTAPPEVPMKVSPL